jgi:8-oxo-dGTP pyrophosphatase MutT (NUDIX family)
MVSKLSNAALEIEGQVPAVDRLDLDSVAALIFRPDGRYLLQHRENRSDISYPNWWSLFGGARNTDERAEDAMRRELREELELTVQKCVPFLGCTFEIWFEGRLTRKIFFSVETSDRETQALVLHEGQGLAWFTLDEILALGAQIVPYDLGVISLHHSVHERDYTGSLGQFPNSRTEIPGRK